MEYIYGRIKAETGHTPCPGKMATYPPMMASHTNESEGMDMKKSVQETVNAKCLAEYDMAMDELKTGIFTTKRLRSCTATVIETNNYWILRSYNTIVAVTSKNTGVCYDVLRIVYGYTATSAQHIAKFCHDYHTPEYHWGAEHWIAR